MTLQDVISQADAIALGRVLYLSINGDEAVPVRDVVLDMDEETLVHRIVLTNTEVEECDV